MSIAISSRDQVAEKTFSNDSHGLTFLKKCCVETARASKPRMALFSSPRARPSCLACHSHLSLSRWASCRSASRACRSGLGANPFRGAVVLCFGYPVKRESGHLWYSVQLQPLTGASQTRRAGKELPVVCRFKYYADRTGWGLGHLVHLPVLRAKFMLRKQ